jgi:hypothetical protein
MVVVWIGLSVCLMALVERTAGLFLSRTERGAALAPDVLAQAQLHLFEAAATSLIGLGGLCGALYHFGWVPDLLWGRSAIGDATFFLMEGYLIHHGVRMLRVDVEPRMLIVHHALMIVPLAWLWHLGALYPYAMLMAIPSFSAVIRDHHWFRRHFTRQRARHATGSGVAVAVLDSVPPLVSLSHFFMVGVHRGALPISVWAVVVLPTFAIVGLALSFAWKTLVPALQR